MTTKRTAELAEVLAWPGVSQAARQLGISINRTYHLIWVGKLTAQQIAGQWRISPDAINSRLQMKEARHGNQQS